MKTTRDLSSRDFYATYRRSIVERHIAKNGRYLQYIWLIERAAGAVGSIPEYARQTEEQLDSDGSWRPYTGGPAFWASPDFLDGVAFPAGGDNPLLHGGLCMAVFAMEDLSQPAPAQSFDHACKLLAFFLESEWVTESGERTGLLTRRKHYWRPVRHASTDELSGCLLGLYLLWRAASRRKEESIRDQVESLLRRMATFLRDHHYIYAPPDGSVSRHGEPIEIERSNALALVYAFPFSRLFEEVLGSSFLPPAWPSSSELAPVLADISFGFAQVMRIGVDAAVGGGAFAMYLVTLEALSTVGEVSAFEEAYFNFAMTCHTVVLSLLLNTVNEVEQVAIAKSATRMLMGVMRYEEQPGYDNVYFGVVGKICDQVLPPSELDLLEAAVRFTPNKLDDTLALGADALLGLACRGAHFVGATVGAWAVQQRKECSERRDAEERACREEKEVSRQECALEAETARTECVSWGDEGYSDCAAWGPFSFLCSAWVWVSVWVCQGWSTIVERVCVAWETIKEWVCVAWEDVIHFGCQAGTWILAGLAGLFSAATSAVVCRRSDTWRLRLEDATASLNNPEGIWFRDLPIGVFHDKDPSAPMFRHQRHDGTLLIGANFTWENRDPNHTFTTAAPWNRKKAYDELGPDNDSGIDLATVATPGEDFDLTLGLRLEAGGMDFVYPRALLAFVGLFEWPEMRIAQPTSIKLPLLGSSIETRRTGAP